MIDPTSMLVFLGAALLLNISPGPDLLYVTSTAIRNGDRVGIAAAAGIASGAMFHVVAAAFGLSAIIASSDLAFGIIKWLGAGYLIFLGLRALSKGGASNLGNVGTPSSALEAFRQGVFVDLINPKSALFFMAFLPQFADLSVGHVPLQLMALGMTVILVGFVVESLAALGAARLTCVLRERPKFTVWLDRLLGCLLIGLGIRLAFQQRS